MIPVARSRRLILAAFALLALLPASALARDAYVPPAPDSIHAVSAEHGLGVLRRDESARYKSSTELTLMRAIKRALDPLGLMNPGKLLGASPSDTLETSAP